MSKTNPSSTSNTQLLQRIIHLKSELTKYRELVEDYENNYHYSQLRKLKLQNKELRAEIETTSLQLQEMYKKLENTEVNLKHQFDLKSKELNQSIKEQKSEIEKLINDNNRYQDEISSLKGKLEDYKKNNKKMNQEITSLNERLKEKNDELIESQENSQALLLENAKQKGVITDLQTTNESLRINIENLSKENNQFKKEIKEQTNIITTIKEERDNIEEVLKSKEEQSKVDLSNAQKELLLYVSLHEKLKGDYNDLMEDIKIYKGKHEETNNNYASSKEKYQLELSHSKKQLDTLQMELEDVKNKYSYLEQENNTLRSSKFGLEQNVEHYRKQNEYLIKKNEDNFSSLIKTNTDLLSQIDNIQNYQKELITTVNVLKEDFSSFFSVINLPDGGDYEISELFVSILDHQFKKALENSLVVENEDNSKSISIHDLELKLEELAKEIESTSNKCTKDLD